MKSLTGPVPHTPARTWWNRTVSAQIRDLQRAPKEQ